MTGKLLFTHVVVGNTGSLRYMAPEVAKNQAYNEQVDIYSFGVIMWQVATGVTPFGDLNRNDFYPKVVERNHRPSLELKTHRNNQLTKELSDILKQCWDPNFMNRCTATEVLERLSEIIEGLPVQRPSTVLGSLRKLSLSMTGGK